MAFLIGSLIDLDCMLAAYDNITTIILVNICVLGHPEKYILAVVKESENHPYFLFFLMIVKIINCSTS